MTKKAINLLPFNDSNITVIEELTKIVWRQGGYLAETICNIPNTAALKVSSAVYVLDTDGHRDGDTPDVWGDGLWDAQTILEMFNKDVFTPGVEIVISVSWDVKGEECCAEVASVRRMRTCPLSVNEVDAFTSYPISDHTIGAIAEVAAREYVDVLTKLGLRDDEFGTDYDTAVFWIRDDAFARFNGSEISPYTLGLYYIHLKLADMFEEKHK